MHTREPMQCQNTNVDASLNRVQEPAIQTTPSDPINRLAEVLVGMNNRPSVQTLMVRPVSTTTLTFEGKSEKYGKQSNLGRHLGSISSEIRQARVPGDRQIQMAQVGV